MLDDDVAFCGGIDMTVDRWDTRGHEDGEPRRVAPNGTPYKPWHDATTMLEGPVAAALGDLCRERWRASGGAVPRPPGGGGDCWPAHVDPDFEQVEVGSADRLDAVGL